MRPFKLTDFHRLSSQKRLFNWSRLQQEERKHVKMDVWHPDTSSAAGSSPTQHTHGDQALLKNIHVCWMFRHVQNPSRTSLVSSSAADTPPPLGFVNRM